MGFEPMDAVNITRFPIVLVRPLRHLCMQSRFITKQLKLLIDLKWPNDFKGSRKHLVLGNKEKQSFF